MIEGLVGAVATVIVEKGVRPVVKQCRYMCCLKQFEEDMDNEEEDVSGLKDALERQLDAERKNTKLPLKIVENWINNTARAMNDVHALKTAIRKKKDERCFKNSWCPNCFWQHSQSKQADCLVGTLRILKARRNELPRELTYEADIPNVESILDGFLSSSSSTQALNEIMVALQTDGMHMIGLHGMPGVGKTTLVKKVVETARESKLFDECVMITVTQKPKIHVVQYRLAQILGVEFKESSGEQLNAGRLMSRIKDSKRKLLVMDNVWGEINLTGIGIPPIHELNNCKILLTTRSLQVCIDMNCQRNVVLNTLREDDEWALFAYAAHLNNGVPTELAKQVARECCGLPLAIMSVGKTLKGKTGENAWKRALEKLRGGGIEEIQGISREENPYRSIKFSFDELGEKGKGCLLLCSLFPRDYGIFVDQLAKYAKELDLYQQSSGKVLSEIIERVEELKGLHLLFSFDIEEEKNGVFQMHDLIHDVVRKIGRRLYLASGAESRNKVEGYLRNTSFIEITTKKLSFGNDQNCPQNCEKSSSKL